MALTFSMEDDGTNNQMRIRGASLQPLVTAATDLSCGSLSCSLLKVAPGQDTVYVTTQSGVVLLSIGASANTFLNGVSAPAMESTGDVLVSNDVIVGNRLVVQGTNVLDAIANSRRRDEH